MLRQLGRARFTDAGSLIRFHEALLFFRAYPPNPEVLRLTDELLRLIPKKIAQLRRAGVDLTPFEEPEVSGIAGTAFSALFTYEITRWLAEHHPRAVEIDWDGYDAALLGPLLRRLHPFADEDLLVEANIPYMDWFRAAKRGGGFGFALVAVTNRQRGTVRAGQNLRPLATGRGERHAHEWTITRASASFSSTMLR